MKTAALVGPAYEIAPLSSPVPAGKSAGIW